LFSISRVTRTDQFAIDFRKNYADVYNIQSNAILCTGFDRDGSKYLCFNVQENITQIAFPTSVIKNTNLSTDDKSQDNSSSQTKMKS